MGQPSNADIVLLRWPFSNQPGTKRRPGLILCSWEYASQLDLLVALVTTKQWDARAIEIPRAAVVSGELLAQSWVRPSQLFTVDASVVSDRVASIDANTHLRIIEALVGHLRETSRIK